MAKITSLESANSAHVSNLRQIRKNHEAAVTEAQSALEAAQANVAQIDEQLRALGGSAPKGRGRPSGSKNKGGSAKRGPAKGSTRATNKVPLTDAVVRFLGGFEYAPVADIVTGVGKMVDSSAASFPTMVNQSIGKNVEAGLVRRVERGVYALTAKGEKSLGSE